MFTALIMHLIHSPICTKNNEMGDAGNELQLLSTYAAAQNLAFKFLTLFFRSCGTKQGEDDHRTVFENFLADLLLTANRPEWPASEILLTLLSRILMKNFSNHSLPLQTRLQSLDYLGLVAAQLRKDSIDSHELNSRENRERLDQVVEKVTKKSFVRRIFDTGVSFRLFRAWRWKSKWLKSIEPILCGIIDVWWSIWTNWVNMNRPVM